MHTNMYTWSPVVHAPYVVHVLNFQSGLRHLTLAPIEFIYSLTLLPMWLARYIYSMLFVWCSLHCSNQFLGWQLAALPGFWIQLNVAVAHSADI